MKKLLMPCFLVIVGLLLWNCKGKESSTTDEQKPHEFVVSVAELAVQGVLQRTGGDSTALDLIRQLRPYELNLNNSVGENFMMFRMSCCPCPATLISDICCPCKETQIAETQEQEKETSGNPLKLISDASWDATVTVRANGTEQVLKRTQSNKFHLFLVNVNDGIYDMVIGLNFLTEPIQLQVELKGGKLRYKL